MSGGRHLFGWTRLLSVATDIFDATNLNTQMTGMWSGKPPKLPLGYRPDAPETDDAPKGKRSVRQLHGLFSRGG